MMSNVIASLFISALVWIGFAGGLHLFYSYLGEANGSNILAAILIVWIIIDLSELTVNIFRA